MLRHGWNEDYADAKWPLDCSACHRPIPKGEDAEHYCTPCWHDDSESLAKELGVESKAILQKLKDEGLGDVAPNHMSVIQLGLAESVREWFSMGHLAGGGTAVETAPPIEATAAKTKIARSRKKKSADAETGEGEGGIATSNDPLRRGMAPSASARTNRARGA